MMFYLMLSFSLTGNTQYNELITISSYVLLSYSALNFPIHTLRLLHSHSPASALTLSDFSTNTVRLLNSHCTTSQLTLSLASLCLFRPITHVFRKHPWTGSRRLFLRNYSVERTDDTLMDQTTPRLSRHCLWFDRYLGPFCPRYYIYFLLHSSSIIIRIYCRKTSI